MRYDEQPDAPLRGECAEKIARLKAELAQANKRADEAQKIDSYAQVGAAIFGPGVSWKTLIEAAQRNYVYHEDARSMTHEEKIDEEMKRRELFDMFYDIKPSAATVPAGHQVAPVELSDDLCNRIAVISRVWPEWDIKNIPVAFREAIRNYHFAMIQASKEEK